MASNKAESSPLVPPSITHGAPRVKLFVTIVDRTLEEDVKEDGVQTAHEGCQDLVLEHIHMPC